jgi:hypothetical protein
MVDMSMNKENSSEKDDLNTKPIEFRAVAPALELVCWTVALLVPILRTINGPAVTNDQLAVQIAMVSLAVVGGCSLRLVSMMRRR